MKRSVVSSVVLAAGAVVLLAACSSGSDPVSAPASPEASTAQMATEEMPAEEMPAEEMPAEEMPADEMPAEGNGHEDDGHGDEGHDHGAGQGTKASEHGLTLAPKSTSFAVGSPAKLSFTILGEDGAPTTEFETVHEKPMHLLVVRHDLTNYVHAHPEMAPDGTWTVMLPDLPEGTYRMVADFTPTEHSMEMFLGTDFTVGQADTPAPSVAESRSATVDGYTAELVGDTKHEGKSALKVVLTKDGAPVTQVTPYLGAGAHFVSFGPDLGVTHMHPNADQPDASGALTFTAPAMGHDTFQGFVQVDFGSGPVTFPLSWVGE